MLSVLASENPALRDKLTSSLMAERLSNVPDSIWGEITKLSHEYDAVNLGQGMPDFLAPVSVLKALEEVAKSKDWRFHQYTGTEVSLTIAYYVLMRTKCVHFDLGTRKTSQCVIQAVLFAVQARN